MGLSAPGCPGCDRLRLMLERCKIEWDGMASKVMLTERELRWMSKRSGAQIDRMLEAERKAKAAQTALESAIRTAANGKLVRTLLLTEKILAALSREHARCASCGWRSRIGHKFDCRIVSALNRIADVIGFHPLPTRSRLLRSPALPRRAEVPRASPPDEPHHPARRHPHR